MWFLPTVRVGVCARILATSFLIAAALVATSVAHAATFVVNTTSWGYDGVCDASDCSLIDAILEAEAAPDADDIVLQPCETYTLFFLHEIQSGLPQIYTDITIHGNGATIRRFPSAPDFRLFLVRPSGNLTLDRLTLRWGKVVSAGAGIFNMGTLTVLNSVIENNSTYSDTGILLSGGGIYNMFGSDFTLEHSTVRNNTSVRGAGIASNGNPSNPSTVTIRNSAIVNNQAIDGLSWSVGGGLLITDDVNVSISDTTISSNYALYRGGGVLLYGIPPAYTVSFRNVTITDNVAENHQGGGIDEQTCGITCIDPTDPLVENSIIANNTADFNPDWVGEYVSGGNNIIGVGSGSFPTTTGDQTVTTLADIGPLVTIGQAGDEHHRLLF
ncbi:MAG: right-handed parallel beta-helix repeat-containing protein, partial [bacterium]|nr:right-handed parallel beta-helix repeat-containing protein [bacterium]